MRWKRTRKSPHKIYRAGEVMRGKIAKEIRVRSTLHSEFSFKDTLTNEPNGSLINQKHIDRFSLMLALKLLVILHVTAVCPDFPISKRTLKLL